MAEGIIFAYSYNKFHATLTTRAQNTISTPTCVPETRFCCLKICGWDSGQPFVKSPGSSNTRPPCTYTKRRIPGGIPGGGWSLQELTHALCCHFLKLIEHALLTYLKAFPNTSSFPSFCTFAEICSAKCLANECIWTDLRA